MIATTTLKYLPGVPSSFFPSFALGVEATYVRKGVADAHANFITAESIHAQNMREFQNMFFDTKEENWDGYAARPVSAATYYRAKAFLKQCLGRYPAPASGATPTGSFSFEWYVAPTKRCIVSISEEDELAYAGLFGSATVHGTETFHGELPPAFSQYLGRLYPV